MAQYLLLKRYVLLFCDSTNYFFLNLKSFVQPLACFLCSLPLTYIHSRKSPARGEGVPSAWDKAVSSHWVTPGFVPVSAAVTEKLGQMIQLFCTSVPSDEILMFLQVSEDYSDYLESALRNCY